MVYPNLKFPKKNGRPFFYTNFVSTVDGKIQVLENTNDYWPIGSKIDHQVLLELRTYADCLIHGGNLGREFGEITLNSLNKPSFKLERKKLGKNPQLPYYIVTSRPEAFTAPHTTSVGSPDHDLKIHIVTGPLQKLSQDLLRIGYKNVLIEGGPTLLGSFLKINLIDEIFLTIAPKIFGNKNSSTLTLVEGYLFPKKAIKTLSLLSCKKLGSEIYLRYKVRK